MVQHDSASALTEPEPHGPLSWLALVGWLALSAAAAVAGAVASRDAASFYGALAKPTWAPPAWLFGPVWSVLYVLMGVAAWLVWRARPAASTERAYRRSGLTLFVGQLVLNALWTWLFFAWREGALAFGEIALLWLAIAGTIWHFGRVRPLAAWCLVPYVAWVTFAMALNWAVWQRNPTQL